MLVEANYKLGIEGEGQEDMVKVAHCYKTNIESFTKKNKGLKSL
jgi:hypothetical protein